MKPVDAVIVGAGPAGSAAATVLARRGYRVALIDRAQFPRDKPCGDYCNPGAVRTLHDLGCSSEVLASGAASISTMAVFAQDGSQFEAPFPSGGGLLIPRKRLDAILVEHAARQGAQIMEGFQVDEVSIADDQVAIWNHPRHLTMSATLLIAADGMRSTVARRLGMLTTLARGRYTIGAYFSGFPGSAPHGELHLGPNLYCGVAHFGGGVANVCMALPRDHLRKRTLLLAFTDALRHLPVLADAMKGVTRESAFRCTGPVGFAAHNVVTDRTLLVGDAAGQIEPMTGQGIYLAMRSGCMAGDIAAAALERGDFSRAMLAGYARRRAEEIAGTLKVSRWLQRLAFHPRLTPHLVRRLARQPVLAGRLLGATGDVLAPDAVLSAKYVFHLLADLDAHRP